MKILMKRYKDLRMTQEERIAESQAGCLTIFVNKAHTIAHGVYYEDPDVIMRLRLPGWLKGTQDNYVYNYLLKRTHYLVPEKVKHVVPKKPKDQEFLTERRCKYWRKKWQQQ